MYSGKEVRELKLQSVYRFDPDGKLLLITDKVEKPNGIVLSPDEHTLYIGDHNNAGHGKTPSDRADGKPGAMNVLAFALDENGLVTGEPRTLIDFSPENGCDGVTVDAQGNLYITCRSLARPGLMVLDPAGKELAFLQTGASGQTGDSLDDWQGIPSNVEFGLDDGPNAWLYVTIDKGLYRVRTKQHGARPLWADAGSAKN
jgi:gluconolactonase